MSDNSSDRAPNTTSARATVVQTQDVTQLENDDRALQNIKGVLVKEGVKPEKTTAVAQTVMMMSAEIHSGPLPSVKTFEGYERVCPGASRDILDMAIRAQKHNNSVERMQVMGELISYLVGILAAVSVIALVLYFSWLLARDGHDWVAGALVSGTGIASIIGAWFRQRQSEPEEKPDTKPQVKKKRNR